MLRGKNLTFPEIVYLRTISYLLCGYFYELVNILDDMYSNDDAQQARQYVLKRVLIKY